MSTASYLLNRRGYFHLRYRIPSDLSAAIPSRQIVKSFKTKDKNTARIAVLPYQQGIFKTFSPTARRLCDSYLASRVPGALDWMVFFDNATGKANVVLNPNVKLITAQID